MTLDLAGRAVVITGAGGGLGRAHALLLARRGALVVVNDRGGNLDGTGSTSRPADVVVDEITAAGGVAVANHDSVATPEGGAAIVATAIDAYGRLDAVVHNAGILRDKTITRLEPGDLDAVIDVHLKGAFHVIQPAWPSLKASGSGRVVVTSSTSGILGNFGQSNYGAAKMGLVGLANVLALEGQRSGIKVNALAPGGRTRMNEDLVGELGRVLDPELVSPMVAYLVSAECQVTGEILAASAGRFARYFVGVTPGWDGGRQPTTPEDIAAHLDEIRDPTGFAIPESGEYELEILRRLAEIAP